MSCKFIHILNIFYWHVRRAKELQRGSQNNSTNYWPNMIQNFKIIICNNKFPFYLHFSMVATIISIQQLETCSFDIKNKKVDKKEIYEHLK